MTSPRTEIIFAGHALVLDAAGALFWPAESMLVVSDMHLEKSTYFAARGSLIAPYDTHDTLARLAALVDQYQPQTLLLLGDSFHDARAWERLDASLRTALQAITHRVPHCHWVEGNHDRQMLQQVPGARMEYQHRGGIAFNHERDAAEARPQIIGHYHPKITLPLATRKLRGPCFLVTPTLLVMPAFGSYTGGLDLHDPAFFDLLGNTPYTAHLIYRARLYRFEGPGPAHPR